MVLLGGPALILLCVLLKTFIPFDKVLATFEKKAEEKRKKENERIKEIVRRKYPKNEAPEMTAVIVLKKQRDESKAREESKVTPVSPKPEYNYYYYGNYDTNGYYQGICHAGECCEFDHLWADYYNEHPEDYFRYYDYYFAQNGKVLMDPDGFFHEVQRDDHDGLLDMAKLEIANEVDQVETISKSDNLSQDDLEETLLAENGGTDDRNVVDSRDNAGAESCGQITGEEDRANSQIEGKDGGSANKEDGGPRKEGTIDKDGGDEGKETKFGQSAASQGKTEPDDRVHFVPPSDDLELEESTA